MKRAILCGVLLVAGCGRPPSEKPGEEATHPAGLPNPSATEAATRGATPAAEMIPEPSYTPREEDHATLIADATPGFSRASLLGDFYDAPPPSDPDLPRKMIERGEVVELAGKIPILVIRNLDPADAREPGRHYGVEVRLLAGPRKGETWFVDESAVARLVPKLVHPPLAPGSYATVVRPGAIASTGWDAFDQAARSPGEAASPDAFRIEEGVRVVVLEARGEALRVRVDSGPGAGDRVGVVARSGLRPLVPQSSPALPRTPAGR